MLEDIAGDVDAPFLYNCFFFDDETRWVSYYWIQAMQVGWNRVSSICQGIYTIILIFRPDYLAFTKTNQICIARFDRGDVKLIKEFTCEETTLASTFYLGIVLLQSIIMEFRFQFLTATCK